MTKPKAVALESPTIETPEIIATMDPDFVREEAERLARELEQRHAIDRLNDETVSRDERLELGAIIQRLARFRHRLLELSIENLSQEVAQYEQTHPARVAQYTQHLGRK